jgi:cytochrome c peroxidase
LSRQRQGAWARIGAIAVITMLVASRAQGDDFQWALPAGFPEPAVPADNPMSVAKVALGRALFADTRLSMTRKHSCQSCHEPGLAFTDGRSRSRGAAGDELALNAPTLLNVAYNPSHGWRDPEVRTLEQQMQGPLFNEHPRELGLRGRELVLERELAADPVTARAFRAAFPGEDEPVSVRNVIRAIAAFERTLLSGNSAFDQYVFGGRHEALSGSQKRGMELFFSARTGCSSCHGGINFSGPWVDREHPRATPAFADTGAGPVRIPTLRNAGATAPYLHDGSLATLDAVLARYERLASDPAADPRLRRAALTTDETGALRDFLRALDDGT